MNALKIILILIASGLFYLRAHVLAVILFIIAFMMKDAPKVYPVQQQGGIPPIVTKYNAPYRIPKKMSLKFETKTVRRTEWEEAVDSWFGGGGIGGLVGRLIGSALQNKKGK